MNLNKKIKEVKKSYKIFITFNLFLKKYLFFRIYTLQSNFIFILFKKNLFFYFKKLFVYLYIILQFLLYDFYFLFILCFLL